MNQPEPAEYIAKPIKVKAKRMLTDFTANFTRGKAGDFLVEREIDGRKHNHILTSKEFLEAYALAGDYATPEEVARLRAENARLEKELGALKAAIGE